MDTQQPGEPVAPHSAGLEGMPSAAVAHGRRIADIEALRAIAIMSVMVEHANFNLVFHSTALLRFLSWGQLWPGVDLFFVISGFLVTSDLLQRLKRQRVGTGFWHIVRNFWLRRAWRLWPTAWLWLALIVIGSAIWSDPPFLGPLSANLKSALAAILFYANYRSATLGWAPYGASYPYWSLSLEEQFYIVLPFAIMLLNKRLPWAVAFAILLQLPMAHSGLYFFFRSDALLWGVALAMFRQTSLYARVNPVLLRSRILSVAVILACLTGLFKLAGVGNATPPFALGEIAIISAFLVWSATYDRDYLCPGILRGAALWAGSRSYAFYVAHVPAFLCSAALAHHYFTPHDHVFSGAGNTYALLIVAPLLVGSVELTFRFVEQPLRSLGKTILFEDSNVGKLQN